MEGPARALMHGDLHSHTAPRPIHPTTSHKWNSHGEDQNDQAFQQIYQGSLPLLSPEGRYQVEKVRASLSEFKHPGLGARLMCEVRGDGRRYGGEGRDSRSKKRSNPRQLTNALSLREVNQRIVDFIQQQPPQPQECGGGGCYENTSELKFPLLSRAMCRTITSLAQPYHLSCLVEEHKRRLPVASPRLKMTALTKMATREEIEPILRQHGQKETVVTTLGEVGSECSASSLSRAKGGSSPLHCHAGAAQVQPQSSCCHPLDDSNVGNQMLQGMGWTPGMGLGRHCDGIKSPVQAHHRIKRSGLGFT